MSGAQSVETFLKPWLAVEAETYHQGGSTLRPDCLWHLVIICGRSRTLCLRDI